MKTVKNNMYKWVEETINFIGGRCTHDCSYCYVKSFRFPSLKKKYSGKLRLIESEFEKPLGSEKTIFICSCNDMFAKEVPDEWIHKILEYCRTFDNNYLFQTKNPERFQEFMDRFPKNSLLGITLETNRDEQISKAPSPYLRKQFMTLLKCKTKMVSIEPIIDFDLSVMLKWIKKIKPEFVSIGADSKRHTKLPEPSWKKVQELIKGLEEFTQVKIKDNLKRLNK